MRVRQGMAVWHSVQFGVIVRYHATKAILYSLMNAQGWMETDNTVTHSSQHAVRWYDTT